jgi:16S rRNA (guanine966-N2)-methyltransferase
MRIVGGAWSGVDLISPSGRVRPTAEAVRGAWLDYLEPDIKDSAVLDLFAGSGALGFEALSRGARSCDFVETGRSALHALKANVAGLRARRRTRVFQKDALDFAAAAAEKSVSGEAAFAYDLAFADPPYGSGQLDRLVDIWLARPFSRILSVEHASAHHLSGERQFRRFGETTVSIYRVDRGTQTGAEERE